MTALTGLSPDYTALQKEVQAVSEKLDPIAVEADQSSGRHQQVLAILREWVGAPHGSSGIWRTERGH